MHIYLWAASQGEQIGDVQYPLDGSLRFLDCRIAKPYEPGNRFYLTQNSHGTLAQFSFYFRAFPPSSAHHSPSPHSYAKRYDALVFVAYQVRLNYSPCPHTYWYWYCPLCNFAWLFHLVIGPSQQSCFIYCGFKHAYILPTPIVIITTSQNLHPVHTAICTGHIYLISIF